MTGATGFVGRAVVRALLEAGYHVRALARDGSKAAAVLPADRRVSIVAGTALDGRGPADLVRGAQACVHLVGIIREARGGQTFQAVHVEATRAMIEACRHGGVERFVHMSALGVRPDSPAPYARTKFEGERLVRRSGLAWTVFRPGLIHGPEGEFVGMVRQWCRGKAPPYLFIPYFTRRTEHDEGAALGRVTFDPAQVAPVSVEDVAECFVRSLERREAVGEVYNLVGSETTDWRRMLMSFRDTLPGSDGTLPVVGLWGQRQAAAAKFFGAIGLGAMLPFDAGQAMMAQEDSTASLEKVRAHLGVTPRGFGECLRAYAGAMA